MMPPGMDFGGGEKTDAPKPPQRPGNEPGQGNGRAGNENATAGEFGRDSGFYVLDADWDESEHPRGDDGKFKSGSGAGKNREERGAARTKIRNLYKKKPTPAVKAQIEKLKVVSGDKAGKKDLTPGQYNANMQECKKHLLGRSYRPGKKVVL